VSDAAHGSGMYNSDNGVDHHSMDIDNGRGGVGTYHASTDDTNIVDFEPPIESIQKIGDCMTDGAIALACEAMLAAVAALAAPQPSDSSSEDEQEASDNNSENASSNNVDGTSTAEHKTPDGGSEEKAPAAKRMKVEFNDEADKAKKVDETTSTGTVGSGKGEMAVLKCFVESLATIVAHSIYEARVRCDHQVTVYGNGSGPRLLGNISSKLSAGAGPSGSSSSSSGLSGSSHNVVSQSRADDDEERESTKMTNFSAANNSDGKIPSFPSLAERFTRMASGVSTYSADGNLDSYKTDIMSQESIGTFTMESQNSTDGKPALLKIISLLTRSLFSDFGPYDEDMDTLKPS
jgi:hypothetical protein